MSTATTRSARVGGGSDDERRSTAWLWPVLLGALTIVGFLIAWLGGWIRPATDPRVREILAMQDEAQAKFGANGGPATLGEATVAVAAMAAIRQKVDALPEELRPQVERAGRSMMRDVFRARIDAYFSAPPEQRRAELDRQIDQEEFMRKAFEAGQAVMSVVAGGPPGGGGGAGGGPAGPPPTPGGGGAGGGPPRGRTEDDGNRWRKSMIDRTTPGERARYAEYRRAMEQRRQERGLATGPPGPPAGSPR